MPPSGIDNQAGSTNIASAATATMPKDTSAEVTVLSTDRRCCLSSAFSWSFGRLSAKPKIRSVAPGYTSSYLASSDAGGNGPLY